MKTTPISYSRSMAVARRDGIKTMTRRVVKAEHLHFFDQSPADMLGSWSNRPLPYGKPGDLLWVKEEHYLWGIWKVVGVRSNGKPKFRFVADQSKGARFDVAPEGLLTGFNTEVAGWHKRIAMFMPRWASRGLDEIVSVRVERLQDISEEDALAEGITHSTLNDPRVEYRWLWESINGQGSWDLNPWVWVIEFKVLKGGAA